MRDDDPDVVALQERTQGELWRNPNLPDVDVNEMAWREVTLYELALGAIATPLAGREHTAALLLTVQTYLAGEMGGTREVNAKLADLLVDFQAEIDAIAAQFGS